MKDTVILKAKDLSIEIDGFLILDKINLSVYERELLGITGLSGAGKTTLLSSLIGVFSPLNGDVYFSHVTPAGKRIFKSVNALKQHFRKHIGFSSQVPSFYDKLTVEENMRFFSSFYGLDKYTCDERIKILLDLFDLYLFKDKRAEMLSGGMRKRLDIACAMINNPKILFLDEPTANLDPLLKKQMWSIIQKINEKGTTVIVASHMVSDLEQYCDRLVILSEGRIIREGTPNELKALVSAKTKIVLETSPGDYEHITIFLKKKKVITKAFNKGSELILFGLDMNKVVKEIIDVAERLDERIIRLEVNAPSLDELFTMMESTS